MFLEQDGSHSAGGSGSVKNGHKVVSFEVLKENGSAKKLHDDYLHAVIQEVSEAEERGHSSDDGGARPGGSSEDLEGAITFTARKQSSKSPFVVVLHKNFTAS